MKLAAATLHLHDDVTAIGIAVLSIGVSRDNFYLGDRLRSGVVADEVC